MLGDKAYPPQTTENLRRIAAGISLAEKFEFNRISAREIVERDDLLGHEFVEDEVVFRNFVP